MNIEAFNLFYSIFYIMLCAVVLPFSLLLERVDASKYIKISSIVYSIFFIILIWVLVGFRGIDVGVDTKHYYLYYWLNTNLEYSTELVFPILISILKYFELDYQYFLLITSFIFYFYLNRIFNKASYLFHANKLFILFCFFSLFISLSLSINIIRQGVSLVFLWYGILSFLENKNKNKFLFFIFLSFLTHSTSIIAIILFFFIYFFKRINLFYFISLYFVGVCIAYLNIGVLDFIGDLVLIEDRRVGYLTNESMSYEIGFKPQFVLFNTFFLFIFYFIFKYLDFINKDKYLILLKYYIILSIIFFLCFQIPYSDRIGLFSWMMLPILMAPCFSSKSKYSFMAIIVMILIYIGFNIYAK